MKAKICKIKTLIKKVKLGYKGYINVSEFVESKQRFNLCFSERSKITSLNKQDAILSCKPLIDDVINRTDRKEIVFIDETGLVIN